MAKSFGKAGQGARVMAFKRELVVGGIAGVMLLLLWLWSTNVASITKLGLPAIIVLVVGFRMVFGELEKTGKHFKKRARDAQRGARAEEKVEAKLTALPDDYISFHDLAFPGFNIDHLAIGSGGVFVIETKSHGGTITSNGSQLRWSGFVRQPEG
jgi:nuclease-like protein